jgi:alanine-synthesizing transaminase
MNAPVQCALPVWLNGRASIQSEIGTRVAGNLAELDRRLESRQGIERLQSEGGWYAVLRIPAVAPDEQTALALLERGVWVHPGYFFGMPEAGWLVVSLLAPAPEFALGAERLIEYIGEREGNWPH